MASSEQYHEPPPSSYEPNYGQSSDANTPKTHNVGQNGPNDAERRTQARAAYAAVLQRSSTEVVQRIKNSTMFINSDWASPLTAAPNAISVMAICLKTAAEERAAGLQISSTNVTDDNGKVIGTLP
jgi:hypothetical protein